MRAREPVDLPASAGGQPVAMEVSTDPVAERVGGTANQLDVSQAQPMEVSLEQRITTGNMKRAGEAFKATSEILRSFDGHQEVQT